MTSSDTVSYTGAPRDDSWQVLVELVLSSETDDERVLIDQVVEAVRGLHLPATCLEQFQHSVAEVVRDAMQHGGQYGPEAPVLVRVLVSNTETRQMGRQSPGGWGCFLIERTAHTLGDLAHRVIELVVYREGGKDEYKSDRVEDAFAANQRED